MVTTSHEFSCDEREAIVKQAFERRAAFPHLRAFDRIASGKMDTPGHGADRLD